MGYIFEIDQLIARNFNPLVAVKKFYTNNAIKTQNNIEKYFNQASTITKLQAENKELKEYKQLYLASKNRLDTVLEAIGAKEVLEDNIKFSKVLSYVRFDDFTRVWLDYEKVDDTILGVISDNYAAGIVVEEGNKAKALLNGSDKCNYSIFVGEKKAPGIIHKSKNKNYLLAKYVPIWYEINIGDEAITSGMDNIFFEGLKVGKVVSIKKMQDMQELEIEPYAQVLKQKHFFIYKNQNLQKEENNTTKEDSNKKLK